MSAELMITPRLYRFDGLLLGQIGDAPDDDLLHAFAVTTPSDVDAVTIPQLSLRDRLLLQPLVVHRFEVMDLPSLGEGEPWLKPMLIDASPLPNESPLDWLPDALCPVRGVVADTRNLINEIHTPPLQAFLRDIFSRRDIAARYWTRPASARHHHAHPGGLAEHSLSVAEDLATQGSLTALERELGIAGALLHDIGKVWAYTSDMFPSAEGLAMGHEMVGLTRLERQLQQLQEEWADGAWLLRVILGGVSRPRSNGSLANSLLARIRACDQRSCERNAGHPARTARSWMPKPWKPNPVDPVIW